MVISTDPQVGTELKPGDTVTVIVSKGPAPLTVPDVVGKNITEATADPAGARPDRGWSRTSDERQAQATR